MNEFNFEFVSHKDKIKIKVTECLNEAQEKKEISPALDVFETSDFIMTGAFDAIVARRSVLRIRYFFAKAFW